MTPALEEDDADPQGAGDQAVRSPCAAPACPARNRCAEARCFDGNLL